MTLFRKGATYRRISKDRAGLEEGVTRQTEDTDDLATRHDIPVTADHRYTDNDISATSGRHRPGYAELMAAVERGEIDVIVVYALGRLWRNRRERADGIEKLRKHSVSVLCVKGPALDLTTAAGRLLAGLLGEVDTHEVEQMSEREQRKMLQRVEQGKPPSGPRCYGYTKDGTQSVPDEADDVRDMFDRILAGASLSGIAADLNKRNRPNRNGKPWTHNAVRNLLLNERYAALRDYGGQLYPGSWPPTIDEDTWRNAKRILEDENRATSPGPGRRWLLSGIGDCGVCASSNVEMTVTSGSRGSRVAGSTVQPIYRCRLTKHLARFTDPIDDLVERYVIARVSRPDAAGLLVDHEAPDMGALRSQAVSLRARITGLATEFADDDEAEPAEFRAATRRLKERLAEVEAKMAHPQRARILVDLVVAEDPAQVWAGMTLDRQRAVVETLVKVTILPGRSGRAPFDPTTVRIEPKAGMA